MIWLLIAVLITSSITIWANNKMIKGYTETRKIPKQRGESYCFSSPDDWYILITFSYIFSIMFTIALTITFSQVVGIYSLLIFLGYILLGIIVSVININKVVNDCENISLRKKEYMGNIFWQFVIRSTNLVGIMINKLIQSINITIPNPVAGITETIKKGSENLKDD